MMNHNGVIGIGVVIGGSGVTSHIWWRCSRRGCVLAVPSPWACVGTVPLDRTDGPLNQRLGTYTLAAPPVPTRSHSSLCSAIVMPIPPASLVANRSVVGTLRGTERDDTPHRTAPRHATPQHIRCVASYRGLGGNGWKSPCPAAHPFHATDHPFHANDHSLL